MIRMRLLHLCLGDRFSDNHSYQVNNLVKFHKKMGYDVEVIASRDSFDSNGVVIHNAKPGEYIGENGVKITRLLYKHENKIYFKIKKYIGTREALEKSNPDIIFVHGCQFLDITILVNYLKKNPSVKVFVDNHADFSNSAKNFFSRNILHKIIWRKCAHLIAPYTTKFYGVLPARVDFLINIYKLPSNKCELLVMGADDDLVSMASDETKTKITREQYGIKDEDFLVVFGGKIDAFKTQVLMLMDAINALNNNQLKLIVFGSATPDLKHEVEIRCSDRVKYIGWQNVPQSYDLFACGNLACFPGRHSVYWEQAVAQGIPLLCKKWEGTTHVDLGGNVIFLEKNSQEEIYLILKSLMDDKSKYDSIKAIAKSDKRNAFLYSDIAKKAIGMN